MLSNYTYTVEERNVCLKKLSSMKAYPSSLLLRRVIPKKTKASLLPTSMMKRRRLQKGTRGRKEEGKKRARVSTEEMELVNLKLYWENRSIMEENKRLREKALLLRQENRALVFRLLISQPDVAALNC